MIKNKPKYKRHSVSILVSLKLNRQFQEKVVTTYFWVYNMYKRNSQQQWHNRYEGVTGNIWCKVLILHVSCINGILFVIGLWLIKDVYYKV